MSTYHEAQSVQLTPESEQHQFDKTVIGILSRANAFWPQSLGSDINPMGIKAAANILSNPNFNWEHLEHFRLPQEDLTYLMAEQTNRFHAEVGIPLLFGKANEPLPGIRTDVSFEYKIMDPENLVFFYNNFLQQTLFVIYTMIANECANNPTLIQESGNLPYFPLRQKWNGLGVISKLGQILILNDGLREKMNTILQTLVKLLSPYATERKTIFFSLYHPADREKLEQQIIAYDLNVLHQLQQATANTEMYIPNSALFQKLQVIQR